MRSKIRLERELNVRCWNVYGTVARAERREEIQAILILAEEYDIISPELVAGNLLGEGREVVAKRLLDICMLYDLLSADGGNYYLTDKGREAIQREAIFVPQEGYWTIWAADDLLLTPKGKAASTILRVQPWEEPSAFDELLGKDSKKSKRQIEFLHGFVSSALDVEQTFPANRGNSQIHLLRLCDKAEVLPSKSELRVVWELSLEKAPRVSLKGNIGEHYLDVVLPAPDVEYEYVWRWMLKYGQERWDENLKALRREFGSLTEQEKRLMKTTLHFEEPYIDGFERFLQTEVSDVKLTPTNNQDAQSWMKWRLQHHHPDGWATQNEFELWKEQVRKEFSEFVNTINIPPREELAKSLRPKGDARPAKNHWYYQAALDWSL